jgi:hypothetical protein
MKNIINTANGPSDSFHQNLQKLKELLITLPVQLLHLLLFKKATESLIKLQKPI